jgi:hypothetical protein
MTCAEFVQTIVLAITAVIILWYTVETARLRRQMVRQNKIALRPIVLPKFEIADGKYSLVMENCGNGCAVNIGVSPVETKFVGEPGTASFREKMRFKPRSYYLAKGQRCPLEYEVESGGVKATQNLSDYTYRPDLPGPDLVLEVGFADVEGGKYKLRATLVAAQDTSQLPREFKVEPLEEI